MGTDIAMTALESAPAREYLDALADQSDIINRPPLGGPRNIVFGTVQLNISSTVRSGTGERCD